jgi:hypothetical protein
MVSTFSPNKNLELPGHNDYSNTWDVPVNADWTLIDRAFGGTLLLNATGLSGTQALTITQTQPPTIQISGAPTAAITYTVPSGVGGIWIVRSTATGGFAVGVASAAGGSTVLVPAGTTLQMWCDGTANGMRVANSSVPVNVFTAVIYPFAGTVAQIPAWALFCDGTAYSRATYAALNAFLSTAGYPYGSGDGATTFNVPDTRGRVLAGFDPGGATNRLTSPNAATLGSAAGFQLQNSSANTPGGVLVSAASPDVSVAPDGHIHQVNVVQPTIIVGWIIGI